MLIELTNGETIEYTIPMSDLLISGEGVGINSN